MVMVPLDKISGNIIPDSQVLIFKQVKTFYSEKLLDDSKTSCDDDEGKYFKIYVDSLHKIIS